MIEEIWDRFVDRLLDSFWERLSYTGLVAMGLLERAGSAFRALIRKIRHALTRNFIKNMLVCSGSIVLLILILAIRLYAAPSGDIVKLVQAAGGALAVEQIEQDAGGSVELSDTVTQYTEIVQKYAEEYGMEDYEDLIYAVMEQEGSSDDTADIMQSSTCMYNEEYPQVVGGITDADYSIQCGVQYLKYCLEEAGVTGPSDIRHIRLALQGYNYGHNYIAWAIKRDGGYTSENASAFAELMKDSLGWTSYGDTEYPAHVLRYYPAKYQSGEDSAS